MTEFGIVSMIPTAAVLSLAVFTRRTTESLLAGVFIGLLILDAPSAVPGFADVALRTLGNETVRWIILVCGLLGSLIALLSASGAAAAFGSAFTRFVDTKRKAMLATVFLGIAVFIDDYLNTMAVSSSMRHVTERFRVSKQMLAYIVDSTAAPISLLIPISTWAIFFSALIEDQGLAADGQGLMAYISAIPYMFYAWIALLIVILVASQVFPLIGPMRAAERDAEANGVSSRDENDKIETHPDGRGTLWTFVIAMGALIGFTVYFNIDIFQGVIAALFVTLPFMAVQRALPLGEMFDTSFNGFLHMMLPLATVYGGFMLNDVNQTLGFNDFVVGSITPFLNAETFPVLCFITVGLIAFATASPWGVFTVSVPIIAPIGLALDASIPLMLGAMMSGSVFGSHACFYSDATVLAARGSGCSTTDHAFTQFPYAVISAAIAAVFFGVMGFVI